MADIFKWTNDAKTTLDGAHNNTTTTINVNTGDGALFPSPSAGEAFAITIKKTDGTAEICYCTSRTSDALTVVRGRETSLGAAVAQTYVGGETVGLRVTAGTLLEFIQNSLLSSQGDTIYASTANAPARLAIGNSGQLFIVNAAGNAPEYWAPKGYIAGLILSNDAGDTDHDINITAGEATDSTDAYVLKLTGEITKQINAVWAAGDDAGGLFSGTVANDTWYHVFLIRKDSDGTIDAGFDTSVTAANIPAGYTAFQLLDSRLTDGSANFIPVISIELAGGATLNTWDVLRSDYSDTTPGSSAVSVTLSTPLGVVTQAIVGVALIDNGQTTVVFLTPLAITDTAPNTTVKLNLRTDVDTLSAAGEFVLQTNTSSQIRSRCNTAATLSAYTINTKGWIHDRGGS